MLRYVEYTLGGNGTTIIWKAETIALFLLKTQNISKLEHNMRMGHPLECLYKSFEYPVEYS